MSVLDELFSPYPPHLKVEDLASVLGVSVPTAYRWLQNGLVPGYQVAGTWVILRDEVREHMERSRKYNPAGS